VSDGGDRDQAEPEQHQRAGLGQHECLTVRPRKHEMWMPGTGSHTCTGEPVTRSAH
jgi:hypothetical protein